MQYDIRHSHAVRRWRAMAITGLLGTVVISAAGCSGGSGGSGNKVVAAVSQSPSAAASGQGDPLAFSKCMRANGITDFPDPAGKGFINMPKDVDPNSPAFQKAQAACQKYVPAGASNSGPGQQGPGANTQLLQYSRCMRANGVLKFPDPDANGGVQIGVDSGIDPNSPAFKKAQSACQKYQPQGVQASPEPMSS